ncbi:MULTISPECIES: hypothetical protein [unclassified Thermosynechococcus]|uniref:hypothetical protein n=1 Tax=unclassified Thermosynechococcus TaxID=2622553 RepID=UPI001A02C034|nr:MULTISPECIES: hypothetical protein [unclassified Thermosynechococcus]HIK34955.1 hypothetical protein [Thermosynechococcus sp. M98_K2018_005]HIK48216.1 hypothetical protein [Thermosynechococcus sp. M55_K2018_012]
MAVQFLPQKTPRSYPISGTKLLLVVLLNLLIAGYIFWAYRTAHEHQLPTQRNPIFRNLRSR